MNEFFVRSGDQVRITLPEGLVEFLEDVPAALDLVGHSESDPASSRMQVPVYLDDSAANEEYWRWMGGELDESRSADRSAFTLVVESATNGVDVSLGEANAFLRVLVEIRLALAARLGVQVEADYARLDHTDAVVLDTLGELQVLLLRALHP